MGFKVEKLAQHPIVILQLKGDIERDDIRAMLLGSIEHFQRMCGVACLLFDLSCVEALDAERFAHSLQVFQRTSPTFKNDAPILLAFAGVNGITEQINALLERTGLTVPNFQSVPAALTYLELKVDNTNVSQSLANQDTGKVETLHLTGFPQDQPETPYTAKAGSEVFPASGLLRVRHIETGRSIVVIPNEEVLIGRRSQGEVKPNIDLTMWGAFQHGVSRRHALITRNRDRLKIIDLASANGTFLNGEQLEPQTEVMLRDGDEIRFSRLAVHIYFEDTLQGDWNNL